MVIACPSTLINPSSRKAPSTLLTMTRLATHQVASSDCVRCRSISMGPSLAP